VTPPGSADDHGDSSDDVVGRHCDGEQERGAEEAPQVVDRVLAN